MTSEMGNARFHTDKRKLAGVLLAISITVCFFPLARVAPLVNGNGETVDDGIELAALVANLIILAIGILGIALAWAELVHEYSNPYFTFAVSVFDILAIVPYITDIVMIGKWPIRARLLFLTCTSQPKMVFGLWGFWEWWGRTGNPESRNAGYYRIRLAFYSAVMAVAGLTQLVLGTFVLDEFGTGPLPAPITVAMFMTWFPEINIFVGSVYILNGLYGMFRGVYKARDTGFAFTMGIQMLCTLILMVAVQTWYAPGNAMAPAAPTIANLTLGVSLMPIFLDYLARTQPEKITANYYYREERSSFKGDDVFEDDAKVYPNYLEPSYTLSEKFGE